jgi:hypothetical protein
VPVQRISGHHHHSTFVNEAPAIADQQNSVEKDETAHLGISFVHHGGHKISLSHPHLGIK